MNFEMVTIKAAVFRCTGFTCKIILIEISQQCYIKTFKTTLIWA